MGKLRQRVGLLRRHRRAIALDRAGAVAVITAVAAPVLLMIVGFAADYGYASYLNQRLAKATDAAALAAVSQSAASSGGYTNVARLQTFGVNVFNANMAQLSLANVNFTLTVLPDGNGGVVATGNYSYNAPTFFAGVLGFNNIPLAGTAKTTAHPTTYVNYYILIDTSQSMGIASTQADMDALYQRVVSNKNGGVDNPGGGCVFGCHVMRPLQHETNENLAHLPAYGPRINLRIDAAIAAVQSIIQSASTIAGTTKNIQFGLFEIQRDPTTNPGDPTVKPESYITNLTPGTWVAPQKQPLSSADYASLQTASGTINLGNNNSDGTGDTDFHNEVIAFNTELSNSQVLANGTGASATSPLNYVFIITDGLTDTPGSCNSTGHCTQALNSSDCIALKTKATVGVIYTTYGNLYKNNTPPTLDGNFITLVQGNLSNIPISLQNCATSSDYYFEANEGPQIVAAMQTLFQRTQPVSARLTQ